MTVPPRGVQREVAGAARAEHAGGACRTVVGMSWSLRSQNTSKPASLERGDRVGPGGAVQLEADLGHAEPRPQPAGERDRLDELVDVEGEGEVVACRALGHVARSSHRTTLATADGRATCRFAALRRANDRDMDLAPLGHGIPPRWAAPTRSARAPTPAAAVHRPQLGQDPGRRPGVGEGGRADLHRRRAGQQQLDGVGHRVGDAADADDRQVGQRGVDVVDGAHGDGWMAGPDSPPPPPPSTGPAGARRSMHHAEHGVDQRDRLGAALAGPPPATSGRSGSVRAELGPARPPAARAWPPSPPGSPSAEWANMCRRSSRFGQDRLTSTATTVGRRAGQQLGGRPGTRRRCGPRCRPRPGRRSASSAGRSSRSQAPTPGPCRPTLLSIPAAVSCSRGAGLPGPRDRPPATSRRPRRARPRST